MLLVTSPQGSRISYRGATQATHGHSLLDEAHDVVALMRYVG